MGADKEPVFGRRAMVRSGHYRRSTHARKGLAEYCRPLGVGETETGSFSPQGLWGGVAGVFPCAARRS